jgi:hypothetical protein
VEKERQGAVERQEGREGQVREKGCAKKTGKKGVK